MPELKLGDRITVYALGNKKETLRIDRISKKYAFSGNNKFLKGYYKTSNGYQAETGDKFSYCDYIVEVNNGK